MALQGSTYTILKSIVAYYSERNLYKSLEKYINSTFDTAKSQAAIIDLCINNGKSLKLSKNTRLRIKIDVSSLGVLSYYSVLQKIMDIGGIKVFYGGNKDLIMARKGGEEYYEIDLILSRSDKKTIDFYVNEMGNIFHIVDNSAVISGDFALFYIEKIKNKEFQSIGLVSLGDKLNLNIENTDMIEVNKALNFYATDRIDLFLSMLSDSFVDYFDLNEALCQGINDPNILCKAKQYLDFYEAVVFVNAFYGYSIIFSDKKIRELTCEFKVQYSEDGRMKDHIIHNINNKMVRFEYVPFSPVNIGDSTLYEIVRKLQYEHGLHIIDYVDLTKDFKDYEQGESPESLRTQAKLFAYNNGIIKQNGLDWSIEETMKEYIYDAEIISGKENGIENKYFVFCIPKEQYENSFIEIEDFFYSKIASRFLFNLPELNASNSASYENFLDIIPSKIKIVQAMSITIHIFVNIVSKNKQEVIKSFKNIINQRYANKFIDYIDIEEIFQELNSIRSVNKISSFLVKWSLDYYQDYIYKFPKEQDFENMQIIKLSRIDEYIKNMESADIRNYIYYIKNIEVYSSI